MTGHRPSARLESGQPPEDAGPPGLSLPDALDLLNAPSGTGLEHWQPLLQDLIQLDTAGALTGIRAIVAERLRQVRESPDERRFTDLAMGELNGGSLVKAAAWLAAEIDRMEAGQ